LGQLNVSCAGLYELVLDNTYSWTTAKAIRYDVHVTSTLAQLEEAAEVEAKFRRLSDALAGQDMEVSPRAVPSPTPVFRNSVACDNLATV
jgi:hypothetical protein